MTTRHEIVFILALEGPDLPSYQRIDLEVRDLLCLSTKIYSLIADIANDERLKRRIPCFDTASKRFSTTRFFRLSPWWT